MRVARLLCSHYKTLGVPMSASRAEIKQAFKRLSKKHHPDVLSTGGHDHFVQITEAYSVLSDEGAKRLYDISLMGPLHVSTSGQGAAYSSYAARARHSTYADDFTYPKTSHESPYKILSNGALTAAVAVFTVCAAIFHFSAASSMTEEARKRLDELSASCAADLAEAEHRARTASVHDQLEKLRQLHTPKT
eukprot:m.482847 g.482847  ORF g.482847 m.482847 type:complete len:191 (-) comp22689_c0_seq1:58-630(-)